MEIKDTEREDILPEEPEITEDITEEITEEAETAEEATEDIPEETEKTEEETASPELSAAEKKRSARIKEKRIRISAVYDYLETFCYALAVMMVLFLFVFRYVSVDGESMRETLQDNDKLIISDLFYTPKTGDIVVIQPESHGSAQEPIIKRVIATGGQKVYIDYDNWEVYVDDVKLDEAYVEPMREKEPGRAMRIASLSPKYEGVFYVEQGKVFVMGDNRLHSKDSRSIEYGEISENRILGKVIIRLWPNTGKVD